MTDRPESSAPTFAAARAVADAVLYEGYLLYPYRRSSPKNRVRWQFGVLTPRAWTAAREPGPESVAGSADAWRQQTECLLETGRSAVLHVRLRFLQLQHRSVQEPDGDGGFREVDALDAGGQRHLTFDEAVPRDIDLDLPLAALAEPHVREFGIPGGEETESLGDAGRVVRTRWPLAVRVRLSLTDATAPFPLRRLRLVTENAGGDDVGSDVARAEVLRRSLVAAHTLLGVRDGVFHSLLDPPAWAAAAARECTNLHTFPVLAGEAGACDVVLSSPILMYDHPQVAPESPGDLFDATEIDEILSLRTLTLTDEEKREARATDPRAAAIVDRVDGLPPEMMERLHGAIRSLCPVSATAARGDVPMSEPPAFPTPTVPWWDPGADASVSPETDAVLVAGVPVARGSLVRLHPRPHGTDAHDRFLDGLLARVQAVLLDVDDARHVAVTLEDDPGAEIKQWYRRYYYFTPEEIDPVGDGAPS
ncbi:hypothetical protein [Pseudonocardia zijingensis]|jgi:hypothetical protein|uniref:Uncharacterized protein n=1 Tax=Pseudonocardia zijingensis TaxID=153376 RepID=A0ABN1N7R8_9PSEU